MNIHDLKEAVPDPLVIVAELDKVVIGQDAAKKTLSIALLNRALGRLVNENMLIMKHKLHKSNVLLIGPTGVGKTQLIRSLSEISGIPISINDVTSITAGGYIGGKVEDIVLRHVYLCEKWLQDNYERLVEETPLIEQIDKTQLVLELVENGVIYIDEIDKICSRDAKGGRDVNGDMVQNELLKILEEGTLNLSLSRLPPAESGIKEIKTKNILFIGGGAFSGLSDIIHDRLNKSNAIGFDSNIVTRLSKEKDKEKLLQKVRAEDLISYGLKPEFLGRLPLKAVLNPLDIKTLTRIIKEPTDSILKQYTELFSVLGKELKITAGAIKEIATKAHELKLGARSLKSIFNSVFEDELFNIFNNKKSKLTITKNKVKDKCDQL